MIGHVRQYLKTGAWCRRLGLGLAGSLYNLYPTSPLSSSPWTVSPSPSPSGSWPATWLLWRSLLSGLCHSAWQEWVTARPSSSSSIPLCCGWDGCCVGARDYCRLLSRDGRVTTAGVTLGMSGSTLLTWSSNSVQQI